MVKVSISNYQSISNVDFVIDGFTCITGNTNVGKSAIMRAITGSVLNSPTIGMVRNGAKFASVKMTLNDGNEFLWEKGGSVNRYTINGKLYDKNGSSQLQQIIDFGFKSIEIGSDTLYPWYSRQFNPLFLIDKSGSNVTDFLSKISNMQFLQNAQVISNKAKRKLSDSIKSRNEDLSIVNKSILNMKDIDSVNALHDVISELFDSTNRLSNSITSINEYNTLITSVSSYIHDLSSDISISDASVDTTDISVLSKLSDQINDVSGFINQNDCNIVINDNDVRVRDAVFINGVLAASSDLSLLDTQVTISESIIDTTDAVIIKSAVDTAASLNVIQETIDISDINCNGFDDIKIMIELMNVVKDMSCYHDVDVSDLSIDFSSSRSLEQVLTSLVTTKQQLLSQLSDLKSLCEEIDLLDSEINKISVCPHCGHVKGGQCQ